MLGLKTAQVALSFGADDLDGTVVHEKIYHEAGAETPQEVDRRRDPPPDHRGRPRPGRARHALSPRRARRRGLDDPRAHRRPGARPARQADAGRRSESDSASMRMVRHRGSRTVRLDRSAGGVYDPPDSHRAGGVDAGPRTDVRRPLCPSALASAQGGASPMRDHNKAFCRLVAETFDCPGPVFEFGSYQVEGQEGYANLRGLFPGKEYVGCDMRPGPGVDRVEDVTAISLPDGSAGTVLCIETFEHVFEVRRAFDEVFRILKPGRRLRHHVAAELPDSRLSRRLLADDAELPAADARALRRAGLGLSGLSGVPPHGDGGRDQGPDPGGSRRTGLRSWSRPMPTGAREAESSSAGRREAATAASRSSTGPRASGARSPTTTRPSSRSTSMRRRQRDRDRESPIHTAA